MPIIDDVTLKEQTTSTRQSAFEWVLLPVIVLGSLLLIVWGLAFSATSMLPALPQVGTATAQQQAALYDNGDRVKSSRRAPMKLPALVNAFPYHILTVPHEPHLSK